MTPCYSYHHPCTEIRRSQTEGLGLYATGPIAAGELLVVTAGQVLPFEALPSYELPAHPFQLELRWVLAPFDPAQLDGIFVVNHSCEPTAGISGQVSLVALRDIREGEEICYDYAMTDSDPDDRETFAMDCLCKSATCRKRVTDRDWRDIGLQRKYRGRFSTYLAARIEALGLRAPK